MSEKLYNNLNILHITTFLQGGAGKILCSLAVEQKKAGAHVIVVNDDRPCEGYENYSEYEKLLKKNGIHRYSVNSLFKRNLMRNLQASAAVRRMIIEDNVNIIHANAAIPALIGIIARSGISRKIPVALSMQGWGCNKTIDQEMTDVTILNMVDAVYPVSFSAGELLKKMGVVNEGRFVVIPNAIDPTISETGDDDIVTKIKLLRKSEMQIVGCIGTICDRKDQATLIRAIACEELKRTQVVFIGDGKIDEIRDLAGALGVSSQVEFVGYRTNTERYLPEFDVMVLPSQSEGLPLVIQEAFRSRVPVIGSDIPAITEMVKDGVTGYLFRMGNAESLRKKLIKVLGETTIQRKKYCDAAYSLFRKNYTIDKMSKAYLDQYTRLLNPHYMMSI